MSATSELLETLRRSYINPNEQDPGGVFVHEVTANGYWGDDRRCDAVYLGFTNASGRIMVGHELKTSRPDWLRELDKRTKADDWADQCHEFWVVVSDPEIVDEKELPQGWGLMSPPSGRARTRMSRHVQAARKTGHNPSWDALRSVLARAEKLRIAAIEEGLRGARRIAQTEASAEAEKRWQRRIAAQHSPDADQLRERLAAVEMALGAPIDWDAEQHGLGPEGVSLAGISSIAAAVRTYGDLERAMAALSDRYFSPIKIAREKINKLDESITELRNLHLEGTGIRTGCFP